MGTHTGNVITLANSIVGVSVLAMPYCFKQCGILLAILMLLFSNIVTRLSCHYLMKSAIMEKRKNFEMLAFRVFGPSGKLFVELCIIGFMLGTCVAYFVIIGDLGPAIIGPAFGFQQPTALRPSVLIGVAVFVILPLGLLKNVDSLNAVCAATIAFYFCLVLKVMGEAINHLVAWDWVDKVYFWRPSGILQCIPIFSMALSCQTQLFEVFDSLPSTPLDRMNTVVRSAVNLTTLFYIAMGFFGYVAYCDQVFSGNLMMNFSPAITSEVIKMGFLLSVAVSFPLVIFPCRASIHSLLFSKGYEHMQTGSAHIPETRFQCITLVIITISLVTGLLIPNIEIVLGLVGSTIGVVICVTTPAVIFLSLTVKNNNERLVAKCLVCIGLVIMTLGTYTNLFATEEAVSGVEKNLNPFKNSENLAALPIVLHNGDSPKMQEDLILPSKEPPAEIIFNKNSNVLPKIPPRKKGKSLELDAPVKKKPLPSLPKLQENLNLPKETPSDNKEKQAPFEAKVIFDTKKEPPVPEEPLPEVPKDIKILIKSPELPPVLKLKESIPAAAKDLVVQPKAEEGQKIEKANPAEPEKTKPIKNVPIKNEETLKTVNEIEKVHEKEKIIEKIKEHEEAQRKLNEEGAKLLAEIKDFVNLTKESPMKDNLKLINVKTGVISEIKEGILNKHEAKDEKNNLTKKMAEGIPLPLAVSDTLPGHRQEVKKEVEKVKEVEKEIEAVNKAEKEKKKEENEVIEKHDLGRDLLGQEKELREKRDVIEVLKEDSPNRGLVERFNRTDFPPKKDNPNRGLVERFNRTDFQPKKDNPNRGLVERFNQTNFQSKEDDPNRDLIERFNRTNFQPKEDNLKKQKSPEHEANMSKLNQDIDNCAKNETKPITKADKIMKQENMMDDLIKAPSYLSNSSPDLNGSPQLLDSDAHKSELSEMPKKRDLKSLSNEE